jgi:hypothetical protein
MLAYCKHRTVVETTDAEECSTAQRVGISSSASLPAAESWQQFQLRWRPLGVEQLTLQSCDVVNAGQSRLLTWHIISA